jgi:DNA-binding response OmpR family regulator
MDKLRILKGKRILVVDDEPDILESIVELLDTCIVDTAQDFETAKKCLEEANYDATILDVMGVDGYNLLKIAKQKGVPSIMLTAHALSPSYLIKSIKEGAHVYLPKDKMVDIDDFLADLLTHHQKGEKKSGNWFTRLKPLFDEKFGTGWQKDDKDFWAEFDREFIAKKEELEKML